MPRTNPSKLLREKSYSNGQFWLKQEARVSGTLRGVLEPLLPVKPAANVLKEEQRYYKNGMYELIRELVELHRIEGSYCGLAASHVGEIGIALSGRIKGKLVNCEKDAKKEIDWPSFNDFHSKVNVFNDFEVNLQKDDILTFLKKTEDKFAIFDLDFMCALKEDLIDQIIEGLENSAQDRCCLILWTTIGRGNTWNEYDQHKYLLQQKLVAEDSKFEVQNSWSDSYKDNRQPIAIEIFILERKDSLSNQG